MKLHEIGGSSIPEDLKISPSSEYENTFSATFTVDNKKVDITLTTNPLMAIEGLGKIMGIDYEDMIQNDNDGDSKQSDLPQNLQNCGEIGFTVDDNYNTTKFRNKEVQKNNQILSNRPSLEDFSAQHNTIITQATRLGYTRHDVDYRNYQLKHYVQQNFKVLRQWDNLKSNPNQPPKVEEESNIKSYLTILNNVVGIAKNFIDEYQPNIIIYNRSSNLPDEVTNKRNNVYKSYVQKNIPSGYTLEDKNGILYIQKFTMNEIKRMQVLAGLLK
jgi:hypothetical protein